MFSPTRILLLCLLLTACLAPQQAGGFALNGSRWPDGTDIVMRLQLVRPPVPLQDGSPSWDASAADALNLWNPSLGRVRFVAGAPASQGERDGLNSVFFDHTIYGSAFGANVLAVTVYFTSSGIFTETDVIFNNARTWNSYRGPTQGSGPSATYDLHRVALHEFGHVLGLSHPDENGQSVSAIMNSIIANLDSLAQDDIDGARSLYGLRITSSLNPPSVVSGNPFTYQITADHNPTSFSATGLPPGLSINPSSGFITGQCPTSGTFFVDVTAMGAAGPAQARVRIVINPRPLTSPANPPAILVGGSFSYQITAGNSPTTFSASNLPAGLTLDPNTGVISGTPVNSGNFTITLFARSATSEASGLITISVTGPSITSAYNPGDLDVGYSVVYQITTSHPATSFSVSGLPSGLQLDPNTGLISGIAAPVGSFPMQVQAQTAYGVASGTLFFRIVPPRITSHTYPISVTIGSPFTYQITATQPPTTYSATGLPDGLQLDPATGLISGVVTLSGVQVFHVTARGAYGDAAKDVYLSVAPGEVFTTPAASIPMPQGATLLPDPARPRIYSATSDGLVVLNSSTFEVVAQFPLFDGYRCLDLSADGSMLYLAGVGTRVRRFDLETQEFLSDIETNRTLSQLKAGADGRLYATDVFQPNLVFQIDATTGATLTFFDGRKIERSPDHRTLFVLEGPTRLVKYALTPDNAPSLTQTIEAASPQSSCSSLAVAPDGASIIVVTRRTAPGAPEPGLLRSTGDLNMIRGTLPATTEVTEAAISFDGAFAVQYLKNARRLEVIDLATFGLVQTVTLPSNMNPAASNLAVLAVNQPSSHFFFSSTAIGPTGLAAAAISVYPRTPAPPPRSLLNVSTRLRAQTGEDVLIGGFIITGTQPKKVLARAIGPSLPVAARLADPVLELYDSNRVLVGQNNNWNANRAAVLATGASPSAERESAIVTTLSPGAYTAILKGLGNTSGVALVELYDLQPSASKIANISTRGRVETGDNVMIGGFIIGGTQPTKVIARAIGPSLTGQGVAGALPDTTLTLYDSNGTQFAENDNWQTDQEAEIVATQVPPTDALESAIVRTLSPGNYTAIVRGKNATIGVALVEVYNLETN